jgi:hypothetical protein
MGNMNYSGLYYSVEVWIECALYQVQSEKCKVRTAAGFTLAVV